MRFIYILSCLLLFSAGPALGVTHTINNSGFTFDPSSITINLGDTLDFSIDVSHNVVEVSQTTWNNNGNTPLSGGFSLPFGGGILVLQSAGTYYYVCSPHASGGMKGSITVETLSISTGGLAASSFCKNATLTVPFTVIGQYNSGNTFTAQLSAAGGSFASPTNIGTLSGTSSGQISATIPSGATAGTGYRIRVVSSSPAVTGSNNGTDLTVLDVPTATITPAGPTAFCEGQSVQLDAPTGAGLSYTWRRDGTVISGASGASYVATLPGLYSVEVSNGSCSATSANERVIVYAADPTTLIWTGNVDSDWGTVGNWNNPCAVPTPGDTVTIGAGPSPPSSVPAVTLGKLSLGHSAGLTLGGDLEITGELALGSGSITLGGANLSLGPSASITGAGSSNFIVTNGAGELRQAGLGSGGRSTAVLFPVGSDASSYTPLFVQNSGTADEFRVRVSDDVLDGGASGSPLTSNVVDKTWHVSESTAGGSNAMLTFEWRLSDELSAFDRTACYIAHHDGSDWQQLQSFGTATGGDPYQRSISGVSAFSPFAIGDGGSPLPVEYRTLSAEVQGDAVTVRWETERETNSHGFTVERSAAHHGPWVSLRFVESVGGPQRAASYEYLDTPPAAGVWWYRLRQLDMDGSESRSPLLRADVGETALASALVIEAAWPNPLRLSSIQEASVTFRSAESGHAELVLCNLLGQRVVDVFRGTVGAGSSNTVRFNASALPPGVYFYRLVMGESIVHHRVAIMR